MYKKSNIIDNYNTPVINVGQQRVLYNVTFVCLLFSMFLSGLFAFIVHSILVYMLCVLQTIDFSIHCVV